MTFATKYNKLRQDPLADTEGPSLTDQSFKQECDIGFIINSYVKRGEPLPQTTFDYKDCTTVLQYEEAQQLVAECKSNFEMLPSADRLKFHNNVTEYLEFISNPTNLRESYEKGYIDRSSVSLEDVYPEKYTEERLPVGAPIPSNTTPAPEIPEPSPKQAETQTE